MGKGLCKFLADRTGAVVIVKLMLMLVIALVKSLTTRRPDRGRSIYILYYSPKNTGATHAAKRRKK